MTVKAMHRQKGITLVELMIAIAVGLILMTGVVQMFLSSRAVFSTQQGISRVQETGRLAMEFLAKDIREAGYLGCLSGPAINYFSTLNDPDAFLYNFQVGIEALAGAPPGVTLTPSPVSDVLVIRAANGGATSVSQNNNGSQVFIENYGQTGTDPNGDPCYSGICEEDILIVTDCAKARVFQATNVTDTGSGLNVTHDRRNDVPGNRISSWGGNSGSPDERFGPGSEVINVRTLIYYIGGSSFDNDRNSLYLKEGNRDAVELLEGVEDMYMQFGIDTSGNALVDQFVERNNVPNWDNVVAVRLELLVQSADDNVSSERQTYIFAGDEELAEDNRIRQVFTSTVGIRTRLQ